jgi:hypothetical protein
MLTQSKPSSLLVLSLYSLLLASQRKRASRSDQDVSQAIDEMNGVSSLKWQGDVILILLTEHVFIARFVLLRRIRLLQGNSWSWDALAVRVGSKS